MDTYLLAPLSKVRRLARSYCAHALVERVFINETSMDLLHSRGSHSHLPRHLSSTLVCVPWLLSRDALIDFLGGWLPGYLQSLEKEKEIHTTGKFHHFTVFLLKLDHTYCRCYVKKLGSIYWPKLVWKRCSNQRFDTKRKHN